jgi:hypothetical protein
VLFRPWRVGEPRPHRAPDRERAARRDDLLGQGLRHRRAQVTASKPSRAAPLTLRPLEDALHALGLAVNTGDARARICFATERLRTLGEAVAGLSGLGRQDPAAAARTRSSATHRPAKLVSRRTTSTARCSSRLFGASPTGIRRTPATFSVAAACEACEVARWPRTSAKPSIRCAKDSARHAARGGAG